MKQNQANSKAYIAFTFAMFIYGTSGILRKFIPLSSEVICFARGYIGVLFIFLYTKLRRQKIFGSLPLKTVGLIALTGAIMGIDWMVLFEAYNYTSVPVATLCFYMQPTILILLSPLLFKEKLGWKKLLCAAAGILGMFFVSGVLESGGISASDTKGILLGLLAAVLYAVCTILNKKTVLDNNIERTVIQLTTASTVMIPFVFLNGTPSLAMNSTGILALLTIGFVNTGLSYVLYFSNIGKLKMQSVAILGYMDPVTALILSAVILGEKLSLLGLLGAILIIAAAIISEYVTE